MLVLLCACLCGCGKRGAPDFDRLHLQLLEDACTALAESPPERSIETLGKYLDYVEDSVFGRGALAHERERRLVARLNEALTTGSLDALSESFEEASSDAHAFRVMSAHSQLPGALTALRDYASSGPFSASEEAEEAMSRIRPFLPVLLESPSFRAFWDSRNSELSALTALEHSIALSQLVADLDHAAVACSDQADLLLASLAASEPEHVVVRAAHCLNNGDWGAFRDLVLEGRGSRETQMGLEIACALHWFRLGYRERDVIGRMFRGEQPNSLSGILLHACQSAADADFGRAVEGFRELVPMVDPGPDFVRGFLTERVLPARQFNAWCWRSPCPGVADYLTRIEQIRQQGR